MVVLIGAEVVIHGSRRMVALAPFRRILPADLTIGKGHVRWDEAFGFALVGGHGSGQPGVGQLDEELLDSRMSVIPEDALGRKGRAHINR